MNKNNKNNNSKNENKSKQAPKNKSLVDGLKNILAQGVTKSPKQNGIKKNKKNVNRKRKRTDDNSKGEIKNDITEGQQQKSVERLKRIMIGNKIVRGRKILIKLILIGRIMTMLRRKLKNC
eukprot:UN34468